MVKEKIHNGKTFLGIELGSTRIKALLIDDTFMPIASGYTEWENSFENGYWTYSLECIHGKLKACFKNLADDVFNQYKEPLKTVGAIGVSAMMHGYLAFDAENNLLTPFRTWRNTTTKEAADKLTEAFNFNIPQRWSIAHLYQAILNDEQHISQISRITTLSGYIHFLLSGRWELGIGDASGVFPVDGVDYNIEMLYKFDGIVKKHNLQWNIRDILPKVVHAGNKGAFLTKKGADFLDMSGTLEAGIPICPPEGDAGTGMVSSNSIHPKTGNISAGTSIFSMLVLEKPLKRVYPQIDTVVTPDGKPVAMVHCNNCCNELDVWIKIFGEFAKMLGVDTELKNIYQMLYSEAMSGNCEGIIAYNYLSGEHITNISVGRPMCFRLPERKMNLAGFIKSQLFSAVATLTIGLKNLFYEEKIQVERIYGHGGLFKVKGTAQQILASSLKIPVTVMNTAGEGGAWGMALLAAYMQCKNDKTLSQWLESVVFDNIEETTLLPDNKLTEEFEKYIKCYKAGIEAERILEGVRLC